MSFEARDLDTMVEDTLARVVNANVGITDTNIGSVIRTIIEAILNEVDIQYYQCQQIYNALGIDNAEGDDLDAIVEILGVSRKLPTTATGTVTFRMTEVSASDIVIQQGEIISTNADSEGNIIEFYTIAQAILPAGQLSVDVPVQCNVPGLVYVPVNGLCIMETPIIGIESVNNAIAISSGIDTESDDSLRSRAKLALSTLGKGTSAAVRSSILSINGVIDVLINDQSRGVATADAVVVTTSMPPSSSLQLEISNVVAECKSAGIDFGVIYPTTQTQDITVTTTDGDHDVIGKAIVGYVNMLGIGDALIIGQMERAIFDACNINDMDITVTVPSANITVDGTHIIRTGVITVNGVVYDGQN